MQSQFVNHCAGNAISRQRTTVPHYPLLVGPLPQATLGSAVMPRSCASINLLHKLTRPLADGRHINDIFGHARHHERCMRERRACNNNAKCQQQHQVSDLLHCHHKLWHNHSGELSPC